MDKPQQITLTKAEFELPRTALTDIDRITTRRANVSPVDVPQRRLLAMLLYGAAAWLALLAMAAGAIALVVFIVKALGGP